MTTLLMVCDHIGAQNSYPFMKKVYNCIQDFDTDIEIRFHSLRSTPNEPPPNEDIFLSERTAKYDPYTFIELKRHIENWNVDVVHATSLRAQLFCVGIKRIFHPALKVMVRITGRVFRDDWWYNIILRQIQPQIDLFLAPSAASREKLDNIEISEENIKIHHNFLDSDRFARKKYECEQQRRELGISGQPVIGYVGRLVELKNVSNIIHAFNQVLNNNPDACLVLVGDGPLRGDLEMLSKELGIQDHVLFLGYRDDVHKIVPTFDIGVLASEYESFGMPIIEFLKMGCSVVSTDVGIAREISGINVISDAHPDTIYRGLEQALKNNGKTAETDLQQFEAKKYVQQLDKLTTEVVGEY